MSKKAFTIKIDAKLIADFKKFAAEAGITPTAAIKMFMKECVNEKRIPLKPRINR